MTFTPINEIPAATFKGPRLYIHANEKRGAIRQCRMYIHETDIPPDLAESYSLEIGTGSDAGRFRFTKGPRHWQKSDVSTRVLVVYVPYNKSGMSLSPGYHPLKVTKKTRREVVFELEGRHNGTVTSG